MADKNSLSVQARSLPKEQRLSILMEIKETDLHHYLKSLFVRMEPDYVVEVTHGVDELGKDLVLVKADNVTTYVTGVVVKRGNVKAGTLEDVEPLKERTEKILAQSPTRKLAEIESQIKQAIAHPAEMPTIFAVLPVQRVFVVIVGEVSARARERLENEISKNVTVLDAEYLITSFTDHYPEVFFDGRVLNYLQESIQKLEAKHQLSTKGKILTDYFIEPLVSKGEFPKGKNVDENTLSAIVTSTKVQFADLLGTIADKRRIILAGDPGTGKSNALSKIALDTYRRAAKAAVRDSRGKAKSINVPLVCTAKELESISTVEELLRQARIDPTLKERVTIQVIIVDGLDEASPALRPGIMKKATSFADELSCALLVASRKIDLIKSPPEGFVRYELLPFEIAQALQLFEKLISNRKALDTLKEGLERFQAKVPMIPLSLLFLIELAEKHQEIPASATELYDRFFDSALGRFDHEKGIEVLFAYHAKKRFLSDLAYKEFYSKNLLEITRETFESFSKEHCERYNLALEDFAREIERSSVLDIRDNVSFRHRSFLDYFVAYSIHENRTDIKDLDGFLTALYFDEMWGDAAFYYFGLRREITEPALARIFAHEGKDLSTSLLKYLVGQLLQAGWSSPSKIKQSAIVKALEQGPAIADTVSGILKKSSKLPRVVADLFTLSLATYSFKSGFLFKESKQVAEQLLTSGTKVDVQQAIPLLWAIEGLLPKEERDALCDKLVDRFMLLKNTDFEEHVRMLSCIKIICQDNKRALKLVQSKLDALIKESPEAFAGLLPIKKRGFRLK